MKKPKTKPQPHVLIEHCNFQGSDSAGVLALAKAIEANAEAIKALCDSVRAGNGALLNVVMPPEKA